MRDGTMYFNGSVRRFLFFLLRMTGWPFLLREFIQRDKITILTYHDPSCATTAEHLRILTKYYTIISLRQYVDWRKGRTEGHLPNKALVVSLDDGHKGNFKVKELLERYNVPATIFLCTGIADTRRHFWWTAVQDEVLRQSLKQMSDDDRVSWLAMRGYGHEIEYEERQALSREEIEQMKCMVEFQSHTRFHRVLPRCSAEYAADEIIGSRSELERRFGIPSYALAYPGGYYSDRDVELAKEAGYECALTTEAGYNTEFTDLYHLKRLGVYDKADKNELVVRASGLWAVLQKPMQTLRRVIRV